RRLMGLRSNKSIGATTPQVGLGRDKSVGAVATEAGALWPSTFVAAVFAIHPLHVESVAWVAERKDVLSGLFFMLTLWAYVRHARKPPSLCRHLMVVFLFALGLMSKPMLVTLPFVLLLLDYWPLERFPNFKLEVRTVLDLALEKWPLFLLAAASCIVTILTQRTIAILSVEQYPLNLRLGNALLSYALYP